MPTSDLIAEPVAIEACDCLTPLGDAAATCTALLAGRSALQPQPVQGSAGGDLVPLALCSPMAETVPPRWLPFVRQLAARLPDAGWGRPGRPVFVTSSNFGVGSLHAFVRDGDASHLPYGVPHRAVEFLTRELGWGPEVFVLSHACVSAHLGVLLATRHLHAGLADRALVFSFDFLSPFVTGGFHSLKILNAGFPAPYAVRETGSIGLGDGTAFAVLARTGGRARIAAQAVYNEMFHFTSNRPDGSGFADCIRPLVPLLAGRRPWIKGHGTGTLEAGRLEAAAFAQLLPGAPLVSWKGALGHTLGSCGLVELALALAARDAGRIPGTIGSTAPVFSPAVALASFAAADHDTALLASTAFGGAHAALLLDHG